jgi:hypothetical protein
MEPNFQLSPESARALAMRPFSTEQFAADPRACILKALDWLDRAARDPIPVESDAVIKPVRDSRIERLKKIVQTRGPHPVAEGIGVSVGALRGWLRGTPPNPGSFAKVEKFLADSAPLPTNAGVEQPEQTGAAPPEIPAVPEPRTKRAYPGAKK